MVYFVYEICFKNRGAVAVCVINSRISHGSHFNACFTECGVINFDLFAYESEKVKKDEGMQQLSRY